MAQTQTVTILFCDLAGSTALMTRLGDDANDRVRRRLLGALREAVLASRGEEVKTAGDGMMVAFPSSAGDAVACAVAMQRAVSRLDARDPLLGLAIRVGLSSGEASHEEGDWFGVPVVEAARLEHAARPHQILAADVVRILVGSRGGHSFTSVGALDLKGLPEPLPASEVAWEPDPGVPAVPLPSGLDRSGLPFAGRASELAMLREAWEDAVAGERRLVLVAGEQGIGKTRLAAELAALVHGDGHVVLYGRSETDREVPYQPFAEALRWYVLAGQPAELREQVGAGGAELTRIVPALRLRLPDLPEPRAGDPASERQALFEAIAHTLAAVAARSPVLLVLDDLEQAGAPTLALLRQLASGREPLRLLVLGLAGTPVDASPWAVEAATLAGLPGCRSIQLGGLGEAEVGMLLERVEGAAAGPAMASRIYAQTEGSPRFVSELVARLHEPGATAEAVFEAACPYMGLRPFEPGDAGLYFGREEVVGALLGRLGANRVLSVVGASGSGKSSLVRAGLVSRLRAGALPGSNHWEVVLMTPGSHPLAELAPRLGALAQLSAPSVLRDLEADPRTLDLLVRQALAERGEGARVVVVVDQFEELFTLCRDQEERQRFIDALLHAVSVPGGRTIGGARHACGLLRRGRALPGAGRRIGDEPRPPRADEPGRPARRDRKAGGGDRAAHRRRTLRPHPARCGRRAGRSAAPLARTAGDVETARGAHADRRRLRRLRGRAWRHRPDRGDGLRRPRRGRPGHRPQPLRAAHRVGRRHGGHPPAGGLRGSRGGGPRGRAGAGRHHPAGRRPPADYSRRHRRGGARGPHPRVATPARLARRRPRGAAPHAPPDGVGSIVGAAGARRGRTLPRHAPRRRRRMGRPHEAGTEPPRTRLPRRFARAARAGDS